jgi:hypothetical protein
MARAKKLKNKKMNDATFELRKQVMKVLYDVKKVVDLPRITVRITENNGSIMGLAKLGKNTIWIPERMFKGDDRLYLYEVVCHELVHAVLGLGHNENCPLMRSHIGQRALNREQCDIIMKRYFSSQAPM